MIKRILLFTLTLGIFSSSIALTLKAPKDIEKPEIATLLAIDSHLFSDDRLFANEQIDISNIYPNPANDVVKFNYALLNADVKAKITIRNVLGSIIKEEELSHNTHHLEIQVSEYAAGMYFYTLSINSKSVVTKKFLVKR